MGLNLQAGQFQTRRYALETGDTTCGPSMNTSVNSFVRRLDGQASGGPGKVANELHRSTSQLLLCTTNLFQPVKQGVFG